MILLADDQSDVALKNAYAAVILPKVDMTLAGAIGHSTATCRPVEATCSRGDETKLFHAERNTSALPTH
jgi:hypothetical protein